jgi:hypothetical protein
MNTIGPPSRKRSAPQASLLARRLRDLQSIAEYHLIAALQGPFEVVFWALRQRKVRLADKLANEGDS